MPLLRRAARPRPRRRAPSRRAPTRRAAHLRRLAIAATVVFVGVAAARGTAGGLTLFQAEPMTAQAQTGIETQATKTARPGGATARSRPALTPGRFVVVRGTELEPRPEPKPDRDRSKLAGLAERAGKSTAMTSFTVGMLNILGSQHTAGGQGGYGRGTVRAYTATQLLLNRGASIVGFSEIQRDQLSVFQRNAPGFGVYPGAVAGPRGVPQTLAWNTAVWELQEAYTFSIPFSGQIRPQPVVRLEQIETGQQIWVVNVHNSPQGMEAERDRATVTEIGVINALAATGKPVILTGDFNERAEAMCQFTSATPLVSAVGGSSDGGCFPPPGARVDWIFASPELTQEGYLVTRAAPVPSITDHAALFTTLSRP